jgi:sugar phosphate permease
MTNTATAAKQTSHWQAWIALIMGGLFYGFQFLVRVSPDVMTDELMLSFTVDAAGLSFVLMWYYAAYSGMQIPLGVLMDQLGARRIIAAGAILCAVSTYFFSIATTPYLAAIARFMIGLGSACGYLGALKMGSQWFSREKMPMVVGVVMTMGTAGASIGQWPLEYLVEHVGWQNSLHVVAVLGLLIGIAVLTLIGKNPPYHASQPKDQHILVDLIAIVKKPQAWYIAMFGMLMYLPLTLMGDLWGVSFLKSKYLIPESSATWPITSMFIGVALGSPVFAWLTHIMKSRKVPMVIGALATTTIYLLIIFGPQVSVELLCVMMFFSGFLFNGQTMVFTSICEIMPLHASGVAVGFVNMIVMLNGLIFLPVVGKLLVFFWDGSMANGIPAYAAADYQMALAIIPVCLGIALVLTKTIRETYHIHQSK